MPASLQNIKYIFIVMMENRSFDHMLGYLDLPPWGRADIEGIKAAQNQAYANLFNGTKYAPTPSTSPTVHVDPLHERKAIECQMRWSPGDPMMTGFVQDYATVSKDPFSAGQYHTAAQLPVTHFLAQHFCVCDHWFACLPASTQPNRLMAMSGYAMRDHTLNLPLQNQENMVYDWLEKHEIGWRVYSPGSAVLHVDAKGVRANRSGHLEPSFS
jgi:phospholipase C